MQKERVTQIILGQKKRMFSILPFKNSTGCVRHKESSRGHRAGLAVSLGCDRQSKPNCASKKESRPVSLQSKVVKALWQANVQAGFSPWHFFPQNWTFRIHDSFSRVQCRAECSVRLNYCHLGLLCTLQYTTVHCGTIGTRIRNIFGWKCVLLNV